MKRIPGLDGLRAISILLVLCGHLPGTHGFAGRSLLNLTGDVANLGVRVFFIISGYLITLLLLKEEGKTGTISIRQFYIRRTLRIFPAAYFFVFVITIGSSLGWFTLRHGDLLHAYTYTMDFRMYRSWWVGHLWSLSVEEQFYLLWPATLVLLGTRKGMRVAIAVVLLIPFMRLATAQFWPAQRPNIGNTFQTVADTIATGCILAGYKDDLLQRRWFRSIMDSRVFALVPLAVFLLNMKDAGRIRWFVIETLINILIALCVCRATLYTHDVAGKILNCAPLVFIGVLSYSLYLWQQLFVNRFSDAWTARFPQNVIFAFCAALVCHYCIEKPFLRLRDARRAARAPAMAVSAAQG
jgi:peptidoglycan/LPS O-acetylase OafA/YrhL